MIYRYSGFYFDTQEQCWMATLGSDWTRDGLKRCLELETNPEQRAEIEKALAALPGEDVAPKRGQRKRPQPAEGQTAEDMPHSFSKREGE